MALFATWKNHPRSGPCVYFLTMSLSGPNVNTGAKHREHDTSVVFGARFVFVECETGGNYCFALGLPFIKHAFFSHHRNSCLDVQREAFAQGSAAYLVAHKH